MEAGPAPGTYGRANLKTGTLDFGPGRFLGGGDGGGAAQGPLARGGWRAGAWPLGRGFEGCERDPAPGISENWAQRAIVDGANGTDLGTEGAWRK